MTQQKKFTVLVPMEDTECIEWCRTHFGSPEFLIKSPGTRWSYCYDYSEKTTLKLMFFTEADYQLFKDSGMDTWSWLKDQ